MITREKALAHHAEGQRGKLKVTPTEFGETQQDLSLAHSPDLARRSQVVPQIVRDAHGICLGRASAFPSNT